MRSGRIVRVDVDRQNQRGSIVRVVSVFCFHPKRVEGGRKRVPSPGAARSRRVHGVYGRGEGVIAGVDSNKLMRVCRRVLVKWCTGCDVAGRAQLVVRCAVPLPPPAKEHQQGRKKKRKQRKKTGHGRGRVVAGRGTRFRTPTLPSFGGTRGGRVACTFPAYGPERKKPEREKCGGAQPRGVYATAPR